jgi:hypothetical protein
MASKSFRLNQRLTNYKQKFAKPFRIEKSFVDLEEMSENYEHGLIPLVDIAQGVEVFVEDEIKNPLGNKFAEYDLPEPIYADVPKEKVFEHPLFQRNKVPTNVGKIISLWFSSCAKPGQGVRLPEKYGSKVLSADSGHTNSGRIIKGYETLPFIVTDIPDQGNYESTLNLAIAVAGEIFLSINNKVVRRPNQFDLFRIASFQGEYPQKQQDDIFKGFKTPFRVKHNGTGANIIHNLNEVNNLWNLDKKSPTAAGEYLRRTLDWWQRTYPHEEVDGCLSASFGYLMHRQDQVRPWTRKEEDQLGKILTSRWKIAANVDDFIKNAYTEITDGEGSHENNLQVMYGLAYLYNKVYPGKAIPCPTMVDFSKAKKFVL